MEKGVKGCPMIRMGEWVSVSSGTGYPGSPGTKAVKRLLFLLLMFWGNLSKLAITIKDVIDFPKFGDLFAINVYRELLPSTYR